MPTPKADPDDADASLMLAAALAAQANAYAPYSGYPVGAALLDEEGRIHAGCNVENAAFPQGQCAEASALGALVSAGARTVTEILVVGPGPGLVTPCGGCRQKLAEFAGPQTLVHLHAPGLDSLTLTLSELLPLAFSSEQLR